MRKLMGLQYLRAVAAIGVVCFHAAYRVGMDFSVGEAGVDLFFVLSGFLMITITDAATRPGGFIVDRLKRIVPSYWIATLVVLAGALAGFLPNLHLSTWHVVSSFLFIPTMSPTEPDKLWPLLIPGWTLNYEMGFYAIFAGMLWLKRPLQLPILIAVLSLLVCLPLIFSRQRFTPEILFYANPIMLEFAAGCLLGAMWANDRPWSRLGGIVAAVAAAFALAPGVLLRGEPRLIAYGLPAILLLFAVLSFERQGVGVPALAIPKLFGEASYSIYLWHTLAIPIALKFAARFALGPAPTVVLAVIVGVAAGIVAFKLIEQPIQKAFRARRYRNGVPIPAGV